MAFTQEEKLNIVKILPLNIPILNAQIAALGSDLDLPTETAVRTELTRWNAAELSGTLYAVVSATNANFGVAVPQTIDESVKETLLKYLQLTGAAGEYYPEKIGTLEIGL